MVDARSSVVVSHEAALMSRLWGETRGRLPALDSRPGARPYVCDTSRSGRGKDGAEAQQGSSILKGRAIRASLELARAGGNNHLNEVTVEAIENKERE
jgi:hypothetical protein